MSAEAFRAEAKGEARVMVCTESRDHYATYVRATMPLLKLAKREVIECAIHDWTPTDPLFKHNFMAADILWGVSVDSPRWAEWFRMGWQRGKRFVTDMDDDKWSCDPRNEAYGTLGNANVEFETSDGRKGTFWEDGVDNFSLRRNGLNLDYITETARIADAMTTTTHRLAGLLQEKNDRIFVLPNCADLTVWHPYRMERPGFRLGWQGGASHKGDFLAVSDQIGDFVRRHKDVVLVICGYFPEELRARVPEAQVEFHKWFHWEAYPQAMQCLGLDLGIAPLEESAFNSCKSPLKWVEYGAMAVPCAASFVPPYSDFIRNGEDGWLLADGRWEEFLEWAYAHRPEVRAMGKRARERVERDFDADKECDKWLRVIREVRQEGEGWRSPPKHPILLGGGQVCR